MKITCWGSRGSIPVCGPEYIKYGGSTTCLEIIPHSGETIIVDAGTGIRRLGNKLQENNTSTFHLLFTHAHWDHIMGMPFFKPLHITKKTIHIYHCPYHTRFVDRMLSDLMRPPYFPIPCLGSKADLIFIDKGQQNFNIGSLRIETIPLSHPNGGCGYKFTENNKSFVFLTDNELGYTHSGGKTLEEYCRFSQGADLLIHDAEYLPEEYADRAEWGHSCYTDAVELAIKAGVHTLGLFHINQDRTDQQMDVIVKKAKDAINAKNHTTRCFGVSTDWQVEL